jgi:hypothetical protein
MIAARDLNMLLSHYCINLEERIIYLIICDFDNWTNIKNRFGNIYYSQLFRFSADIDRVAGFLLAMATSCNCGETHSEIVRMKAEFRWRGSSAHKEKSRNQDIEW